MRHESSYLTVLLSSHYLSIFCIVFALFCNCDYQKKSNILLYFPLHSSMHQNAHALQRHFRNDTQNDAPFNTHTNHYFHRFYY